MRKTIVILFVMTLCFSFNNLFADNAEKEKSAVEAAAEWLSLVDEGKYEESWEETASFFKEQITKEKWVEAMRQIREPLGEVVLREVGRQEHTTVLPGAPDGEYVVIQYNTDFENKELAIERITPMLDKDGQWRVSGYYIL